MTLVDVARGTSLLFPSELAGAVVAEDVERTLVSAARASDPAAFRAIFDRHGPAVRRFLKDILRDQAAADEATQETFVRAFLRLSSLKDDSKLGVWLLGIARLVALEQRRSRRRFTPLALLSRVFDSRSDRSGPDPAEVTLELRESASGGATLDDPESLLIGREALALLEAGLLALSEDRRTALLLRIDHGLGYEDIAEAMGWSVPKVKNEIHRARLALRAALGERGGGR